MANALNVAQIGWTCQTNETFATSQDFALPGWTSDQLAGVRWHAQARSAAGASDVAFEFDSASSPPTISVDGTASGAGADSGGTAIPGVTVTLTFSQDATAVAELAARTYQMDLKMIATDGTKTIVAAGTIAVIAGVTVE